MRLITGIAAAAAIASAASIASARPDTATRYTYYTVKGKSAKELDDAMYRSGPRIQGLHGYASTKYVTPSWETQFRQGKNCGVGRISLKMNFEIRLPQLAKGSNLASPVKSRFTSFLSFVRRHEETHRAIWIACGKSAEQAALRLTADSCGALQGKVAAAIRTVMNKCDAKQVAFDAAERKRLLRHPFIAMALSKAPPGDTAALAARKK
jgi:predicted secreted Zn-dependent protease